MPTRAYTTEAEVGAFLDNDTYCVGDFDFVIAAASDLIEKMTGRIFIADEAATARLFNGNGGADLCIDDTIEIDTVERGLDPYGDSFETVPSTGFTRYYTTPENALVKNIPITSIVLRSASWFTGIQNQRITAKWGYSEEAPPAIAQAAAILAGGMYMYNRGGASGNVTSEKIGNYAVSYGSEQGWKAYKNALTLIAGFKKYSI